MTDIQQSSGFDEFWTRYPRKVAKGGARRAYDKALKLTTHETLMAGLENYLAHLEKQKPEKRFVCHATTWLNQERWEDEYEEKPLSDGELMHKRLKWEQTFRKDPTLVPRDIRKIFGLGEYARS